MYAAETNVEASLQLSESIFQFWTGWSPLGLGQLGKGIEAEVIHPGVTLSGVGYAMSKACSIENRRNAGLKTRVFKKMAASNLPFQTHPDGRARDPDGTLTCRIHLPSKSLYMGLPVGWRILRPDAIAQRP